MNDSEFIEQRVDDQIEWYCAKSGWNQRCFKRLRILEMICAASIPFVVTYVVDESNTLRVIAGVLGIVVAVISGVIGLYRFQENWEQYRTTSESLKHEKFLYLTHAEPYDQDEPFPLFVQRVESLISKENSSWSQTFKVPKKKEVETS